MDNFDNEQYDKIIFLDIDGVLNDEGTEYAKGIYVDKTRVERLAKIIENTGAQIIMSSSWRVEYLNYQKSGCTNDNEISMLQQYFDNYKIKIAGITECIGSGPLSRPAEIRQWLVDKPYVKRFVILDDDKFWMWNWLSEHLVLTRRKITEDGYKVIIRGLEDEHVEKAIQMLNVK